MLRPIVLALAVLPACGPAPAPEVSRAQVVEAAGWVWFSSAEDGFRGLFPAPPEVNVRVSEKLFTTVTTRTTAATGADGARYLVLCVHEQQLLGLTGTEAQLAVLRDRSTRGADATVESETPIAFMGRPARELELRFPTRGHQRGRARVFVDADAGRGCVLMASPGSRSLPPADASRFMDAFELLP